MDEPTANPGPKSRAHLIEILKTLKEEGKTLIVITHDVNAIPELADRVIVLNRTVVADGTTREVFSDTDTLLAAGLEVPVIMQFFDVLQAFGYPCDVLPPFDCGCGQEPDTDDCKRGRAYASAYSQAHAQ